MNKLKNPLNLYLITIAAIGIIAVSLRAIALFLEWNNISMYFDNDIIITFADVLVVLGIIASFSYLLIVRKEEKLIASTESPLTYIPSGMVSVALLFLSVEKIAEAKLYYVVSNPALKFLTPVICILGIISALSFFLSIFIEKNENTLKAIFSMALVAFLALAAAFIYFDKHAQPTNSPSKIVDMMAYLFTAVFFLYESRINLGRPLWRPYFAFGLIASLVCAYSAIPTGIYFIATGIIVSDSLVYCVLTLTISIFIGARIFHMRRFSKEEPCNAAKCIEALAEKRTEEMAAKDTLLTGENKESVEDEEATDYENYTMDITMPETSDGSFTNFNGE